MSSIAYNLTRKLEWMERRLRYIDNANEIKDWVTSMKTINSLLKEVDIKSCSDSWKPWRKREYRVKKDLSKTVFESTVCSKPSKNRRNVETYPKLSLNENLLKDMKKKEASLLPIKSKALPPRVQLEVDVLDMKDLIGTSVKVISKEEMLEKEKVLWKERLEVWIKAKIKRDKTEFAARQYLWNTEEKFHKLVRAVARDLNIEPEAPPPHNPLSRELMNYLYMEVDSWMNIRSFIWKF